MKFRTAVLLATMCLATRAQRFGSITMGHASGGLRPPNPSFPVAGRSPGMGWRRYPGFQPLPTFWPLPWWYGSPVYAPPTACDDLSANVCNPAYYPPPPDAGPAMNLIVTAAQPPAIPITSGPVTPSVASLIHTQVTFDHKMSLPEVSPGGGLGFNSYQAPLPIPVVRDKYPPIIALRTGGAYSVRNYWVKNDAIYFVTTSGETLYTPLSLLERIYPGLE
jgi:hypothetical protein